MSEGIPVLNREKAIGEFALVIWRWDKPMVTLRWDGTLEYGAEYTPDAASRIFWEAVASSIPYVEEINRLRQERDRLRDTLLGTINQACQTQYIDGLCIVEHRFVSAYKEAIDLLEELGYARALPKSQWELIWPAKEVSK